MLIDIFIQFLSGRDNINDNEYTQRNSGLRALVPSCDVLAEMRESTVTS